MFNVQCTHHLTQVVTCLQLHTAISADDTFDPEDPVHSLQALTIDMLTD